MFPSDKSLAVTTDVGDTDADGVHVGIQLNVSVLEPV